MQFQPSVASARNDAHCAHYVELNGSQFDLMNLWSVLPLALLLCTAAAAAVGNHTAEKLLSRMKRNKFVKKFLEKSKASQDKVQELESQANTHKWPIIAWKANTDVFKIGDDGLMESSPFEAVIEEEVLLESVSSLNVTDFSLKPASSYKTQLELVRGRISWYNNTFLAACIFLCVSSFLLTFVRYWLIGLSRLVLRAGLQIEFPGKVGPMRQEFIYAMAFAIEDDLLDNPASTVEQGFAACLNDIVVAVESYTKNR